MANDPIKYLHGKMVGVDYQGALSVDKGFGPKLVPTLQGNLAAAGTALSATITETALGSITIPGGTLQPGSLISLRFQGIATATNSTDTLAIKAYIGGLAGTALIAMTATDVANNDVFQGEYELTIRTVGTSGTVVGCGTYKSIPAAEGTMTVKDDILASTTINTTIDQAVVVSGTWSTTNAGNSCRLDFFRVLVS